MADILVKHLVKRFGKVEAVSDVSLQIADGEFLVLLGPSGCGKSTILRVVAGLEDADSGEIVIGGRLVNFIDPVKRNVAMVFQNYALYPHMSVYKNIAFPLQIAKKRKDEVEVAVRRAAGMLGLEELLQRLPGQLSGSGSALRLPARSCANRTRFSWTSRSPTSMRSSACRRGWN